MSFMMGDHLAIRYLQLGDVVKCFDGPFGTGTVCKIADGMVHVERPYGHSADFACVDSVIVYVGHETIQYSADSSGKMFVYTRKELRWPKTV